MSQQKFLISDLWDGEPRAGSQWGVRGPYSKAELSLMCTGTSAQHNVVPAELLNVMQEMVVEAQLLPKVGTRKPLWVLGGCLCFWELGLVQVPSLPSLLLGLQHSPALCCTQHSPSQNVILLVGLVPKLCSEHSQAESLGSMGINTLAAQPSAHLCWEQQPNCLPAAPCLKHQIVPFQNPPCLISQASGS